MVQGQGGLVRAVRGAPAVWGVEKWGGGGWVRQQQRATRHGCNLNKSSPFISCILLLLKHVGRPAGAQFATNVCQFSTAPVRR